MKAALFYIEKMTGTNHNGPAWISFVKQSKTGKTIYFNDMALKKKGRGTYFDIETGEEYWISKVKKDREDL